jgi:hypothetical protein
MRNKVHNGPKAQSRRLHSHQIGFNLFQEVAQRNVTRLQQTCGKKHNGKNGSKHHLPKGRLGHGRLNGGAGQQLKDPSITVMGRRTKVTQSYQDGVHDTHFTQARLVFLAVYTNFLDFAFCFCGSHLFHVALFQLFLCQSCIGSCLKYSAVRIIGTLDLL